MSRFSSYTLIEVVSLIESWGHSAIDQLITRFDLDVELPDKSHINRQDKANVISRYLTDHPAEKGPTGAEKPYEVISYIISEETGSAAEDDWFDMDEQDSVNDSVERALAQDGFAIRNGELVPLLPEEADLSEHENELFQLLAKFGMETAHGHLEQALTAHARGEWAGANAQVRTFFESVFEYIADEFDISEDKTFYQRCSDLARLSPPFLDPDLNEWEIGNNGGFLQGFRSRLHPEGSHPGLSDEEDSRFRLHLAMLVVHHYLRRFSDRT